MSVVHQRVNIKGGYSTREDTANSIQYQLGGVALTFVELDKIAPWFRHGVGGPSTKKGDFKSVYITQLLRAMLKRSTAVADADTADAGVHSPAAAAVAGPGSDSQPSVDVDPMDAVMDVYAASAPTKTPTKKRKTRDSGRAVVQELEVPTRPPCAGRDGSCKTVVSVYRLPSSDRRSNGNVFLRVDCVDWLLAYAADEHFYQGVSPSSPAPADDQDGNCSAVAGLFMEYNFTTQDWERTFLHGALVGTTKRVNANDVDKLIWNKLKDLSCVEGYLARATMAEKRHAAKAFLTMWCAAAAGGNTAVAADFDELMAASAAYSSSHGEQCDLEDVAVTAEEVCFATAVEAEDVAGDDTAVAASRSILTMLQGNFNDLRARPRYCMHGFHVGDKTKQPQRHAQQCNYNYILKND